MGVWGLRALRVWDPKRMGGQFWDPERVLLMLKRVGLGVQEIHMALGSAVFGRLTSTVMMAMDISPVCVCVRTSS